MLWAIWYIDRAHSHTQVSERENESMASVCIFLSKMNTMWLSCALWVDRTSRCKIFNRIQVYFIVQLVDHRMSLWVCVEVRCTAIRTPIKFYGHVEKENWKHSLHGAHVIHFRFHFRSTYRCRCWPKTSMHAVWVWGMCSMLYMYAMHSLLLWPYILTFKCHSNLLCVDRFNSDNITPTTIDRVYIVRAVCTHITLLYGFKLS